MKHRIGAAVLALLIAAPFAAAQSLSVGTDFVAANGTDLNPSATRTDISLDAATASGYVTSAKVYWSDASCTNAFTIRVFRRDGDLLKPTSSFGVGPFTVTSNVMTVTFPAISIEQGDLLGIVRVGNCGSPGTVTNTSSAGYLSFYGDVTDNTTVLDGQRAGNALALFASGDATDAVTAILPAVGSVRGGFGSIFRTSLQLLNPSTSPMSGMLIFRPHGVATTSLGSGYHYSLAAGQQISVDLAEALSGLSSTPIGLGSMEVDVPTGQGTPQIIARVYNDAGTAGTAGFYEEPVMLADKGAGGHVIAAGATAFMVTPVDTSRTRFNIGVRTLFSGAQLSAQLLDNAGHVLASKTQRYPADYYQQVDAASFFGGVPVGASKTIKISITDGSAVVYGSTTDNVTNDPSVQYALVAPVEQ